MKFDEFYGLLLSEAFKFQQAYKRHQKAEGLEAWPDDMPEGEWWKQFNIFQSGGDE